MFLYICSFFYQISAWVFLIHMFLYAGFYCTPWRSWHIWSVGKKNNEMKTSEQNGSGQRGPTAFDVDTPVALGCLHAGIGQTNVNNLLSSLNNPTLNSVTFKLRESQLGKAAKLESLPKSTCKHYLAIENQQALWHGQAEPWKGA